MLHTEPYASIAAKADTPGGMQMGRGIDPRDLNTPPYRRGGVGVLVGWGGSAVDGPLEVGDEEAVGVVLARVRADETPRLLRREARGLAVTPRGQPPARPGLS
jgi:hypothetical protein